MKGNNIKNQKRLFPRKGVIQIKMLISISGHLTMDSCIVAIEPSRKFSLFDVMDPERYWGFDLRRIWLFSKFCIWNRGLHTLYLPETAKAAVRGLRLPLTLLFIIYLNKMLLVTELLKLRYGNIQSSLLEQERIWSFDGGSRSSTALGGRGTKIGGYGYGRSDSKLIGDGGGWRFYGIGGEGRFYGIGGEGRFYGIGGEGRFYGIGGEGSKSN
ncbi:Uncharacterized protein Rs2_19197 [Raphanus sativus]|nr:Uncharacterized protein Rs2_19197 [Raphanus sativus]